MPGLERATRPLALPFSYTGRMFVIGRGVEFATAREIALKLLETCRVAAEPLTATDLAHGPVAALDPLFPVWAIASSDGTLAPCRRPRRACGRWARRSSRAARPPSAIEGAAYTRARADARAAAALPPPLRRSRAALRLGARPCTRPRPRRAARPRQGRRSRVAPPQTAELLFARAACAHADAVEEPLDREARPGVPVVALPVRLADLGVPRDPAPPGDQVVRDQPAHRDRRAAADVGDERRGTGQHRGRVVVRPLARPSGARTRRARHRSSRCSRPARARRCPSRARTGSPSLASTQ